MSAAQPRKPIVYSDLTRAARTRLDFSRAISHFRAARLARASYLFSRPIRSIARRETRPVARADELLRALYKRLRPPQANVAPRARRPRVVTLRLYREFRGCKIKRRPLTDGCLAEAHNKWRRQTRNCSAATHNVRFVVEVNVLGKQPVVRALRWYSGGKLRVRPSDATSFSRVVFRPR